MNKNNKKKKFLKKITKIKKKSNINCCNFRSKKTMKLIFRHFCFLILRLNARPMKKIQLNRKKLLLKLTKKIIKYMQKNKNTSALAKKWSKNIINNNY